MPQGPGPPKIWAQGSAPPPPPKCWGYSVEDCVRLAKNLMWFYRLTMPRGGSKLFVKGGGGGGGGGG